VVFFFVSVDKTGEGIVTLVSGLVSGGLAAFIKGERDTARDDRNAAATIVQTQCAGQSADQVVAALSI
jgi:hypothetical protein